MKLPQLAGEVALIGRVSYCNLLTVHLALPPSTSERGYDLLFVTIHWLNDDILLDIFNCYRLDEKSGWNVRLGWRKLSHVCQRWRHLMYESAFHLGMHIQCTHGTPIVDTLDHLPPLPLFLDYNYIGGHILTEQDELGILRALRLHDRVRHIFLFLTPSTLHKCLVLMDQCFPILEHLTLWFRADEFPTLTLPKAFLAPNLRHLTLSGMCLPKRLRLLNSTASLVRVVLWKIQASSYFRPRLLVARLWSLPQLEELSLGFSIPIPRPSTERELLGGQGTPVTLPNLKILRFRGVSAYLESLSAQIRVPLLEQLDIAFFNQITFALPHLSHLINITERFKSPEVMVSFDRNEVFITTGHNISLRSKGPLFLCVMCKQLDWQIDCAAQICGALIPALSGVEQITLDFYDKTLPTEWQNDEIDGTTWVELLRPFIGVKWLYVYNGLVEDLSLALQMDEVGLDPGFLPRLQHIFATSSRFASFNNTRRFAGRPVLFSMVSQPRGSFRPKRPPLLEYTPNPSAHPWDIWETS